jgi:4,5-dihydroxyphthalate decarboxylase
MTDPLALTLACGNYDRTRPLADGRVTIDGAELAVSMMQTGPMLASAARLEFDVVEHSLSTIVMQHGPDSPYVALPIFPSRAFRHNGVYVRADSSIESPAQLRGSRVGISGYTVTAMVWIRGMFEEQYGLAPDEVSYVNGGVDAPGAPPLRGAVPPPGTVVVDAPEGTTLTELLLEGEIAALYAIHTPEAYSPPRGAIRRLFTDAEQEERAYFAATGFFPVMHVLAVQRPVIEAHPFLAPALARAFDAGKQIARRELADTGALKTLLPWAYSEVAAVSDAFDDAFWRDGIEPNRPNLATFVRYCRSQGLIGDPVDLDELFFPLDEVAVSAPG